MASTPFVGEIDLFGYSFAPVGWVPCNGQLLPIADYEVLFALIGTTYGGDGNTTFAVPDLRGRIALHQGQGFVLGQTAGQSSVTVGTNQMPGHTHGATGSIAQAAAATQGTTDAPGGNIPAGSTRGENYAPTTAVDGSLAPMQFTGTLQATGGGQPIDNMTPYLAMNYCIAAEGIFPSQS